MANLTDAGEDLVLDWLLTTDAVTRPTTWYIGLYTTTPTADDGTGGTEVFGGAYARQSVTFTSTGNPRQPTATVTFPTATASWGTINGFGVFDAVTAGTLLAFAAVTTPKTVNTDDTAQFSAADLTISLD